MRLSRKNERGDTIIEVLFAVAVFAMVAVGAMAIMNQGTAIAQRSLEITQVRQQIDAQTEAIRYIHQAYVATYQQNGTPTGTAAQWSEMIATYGVGGPSDFSQLANNATCPPTVPAERPFVLNARLARISNVSPTMTPPTGGSLPPFAHVVYNNDSSVNSVYGIWIEAVPSVDSDGPGFVDFHIRACWDSPGSSVPTTLGTIVRLYEPR
jgi:type II secretory pathway pseudopilin PulG